MRWPDGHTIKGPKKHTEVKVGSGEWASFIDLMKGTFTKPMPIAGGNTIGPTAKSFKLTMRTVGHWTKAGVMDQKYLFLGY